MQLLASGVHPKIASERLGHASVGITLDLYSHVTDTMQSEAALKLDLAMQGAKNSSQARYRLSVANPVAKRRSKQRCALNSLIKSTT